jgi:hypothetical protein
VGFVLMQRLMGSREVASEAGRSETKGPDGAAAASAVRMHTATLSPSSSLLTKCLPIVSMSPLCLILAVCADPSML